MSKEKKLEEWLEDRPEIIKELARKLPPWNRYRLKTTNQHCVVCSYFEDGTVRIEVDGHDSETLDRVYTAVPVGVFGINPDDLEIMP